MKNITAILFCLGAFAASSQTRIYLTPPKHTHDDYHLVNLSDTLLIRPTHMEDMGVWYHSTYELLPTAPNGQYEVYVGDTLEVISFMKDGKKDSVWSFYWQGFLEHTYTYRQGKLNGTQTHYYPSGRIKLTGRFVDDKAAEAYMTGFYETGEIERKNYYENGNFIKMERYDKEGRLLKTDYAR